MRKFNIDITGLLETKLNFSNLKSTKRFNEESESSGSEKD